MTEDFVGGWLGGLAGLAVGHPFDTVKVRQQAPPGQGTTYLGRSAIYVWNTIVHKENFSGLFKGISSPALGVAVMNASVFSTYNTFLRMFNEHTSGNVLIAGAMCGAATAWLTTPIERLKILQQGLFNGLYRGFWITCLRDLGYGPYFVTYDYLSRTLPRSDTNADNKKEGMQLSDAPSLLISGALAGCVGWAVTFPVDVVKSKYQSQSTGRPGTLNAAEIVQRIWQQNQFRGFFAGFGPTMLRAIPVNAATFGVYELVLSLLS